MIEGLQSAKEGPVEANIPVETGTDQDQPDLGEMMRQKCVVELDLMKSRPGQGRFFYGEVGIRAELDADPPARCVLA